MILFNRKTASIARLMLIKVICNKCKSMSSFFNRQYVINVFIKIMPLTSFALISLNANTR